MNELLTKTHVLESAKNGQLLQNTAFSNVKKLKNVEIPKTTAEYKPLPKTTVSNTAKKWYLLRNIKVLKAQNLRKPEIQKACTTLLLVFLLATCSTSPSYAIAPHYQPLNNHSFNYVDTVVVNGNNEVLSKSTSVTPQRHCGFFAPVIYTASQAIKCNAKMTTAHLRPKSVYDWMTRPNKPMANKSGGSSRPRVNPVALISQFSVTSHNSKLLGVAHHG